MFTAQPPTPGTRVRVTQQQPQRDGAWTSAIEGVVTRYRQAKTGSWYAHAKDDQLWLDRLELRLDDGELVILNLDQYTVIEGVGGQGRTEGRRRRRVAWRPPGERSDADLFPDP